MRARAASSWRRPRSRSTTSRSQAGSNGQRHAARQPRADGAARPQARLAAGPATRRVPAPPPRARRASNCVSLRCGSRALRSRLQVRHREGAQARIDGAVYNIAARVGVIEVRPRRRGRRRARDGAGGHRGVNGPQFLRWASQLPIRMKTTKRHKLGAVALPELAGQMLQHGGNLAVVAQQVGAVYFWRGSGQTWQNSSKYAPRRAAGQQLAVKTAYREHACSKAWPQAIRPRTRDEFGLRAVQAQGLAQAVAGELVLGEVRMVRRATGMYSPAWPVALDDSGGRPLMAENLSTTPGGAAPSSTGVSTEPGSSTSSPRAGASCAPRARQLGLPGRARPPTRPSDHCPAAARQLELVLLAAAALASDGGSLWLSGGRFMKVGRPVAVGAHHAQVALGARDGRVCASVSPR